MDSSSLYLASGGSVVKVPIGGGTPTILTSDSAAIHDIAVDATTVYWTYPGGTVKTIPIGGGTPTTLASVKGQPYGIAVDATHVYWTNGDGGVTKIPISGRTPTSLASDQDTPVASRWMPPASTGRTTTPAAR